MKAVVFTPTCYYGGLDVTVASLVEQTEKDFAWVIVDELYNKRRAVYDEIHRSVTFPVDALPPPDSDTYRNLCRSYNLGVRHALDVYPEAELFISLQDYIWPPQDGIERFLSLYEPDALLTGTCSIAETPTRDEVKDLKGLYTIFHEPITERPTRIGWRDPRLAHWEVFTTFPMEWEANWAAVPMELFKRGLRWDERYDRGVAFENQKLAQDAQEMGARVVIDPGNHAISLPHKKYWPEIEQQDLEHLNMEWHLKGAP